MLEKAKQWMKNRNNLLIIILVGILLMVISLPDVKTDKDIDISSKNVTAELNNISFENAPETESRQDETDRYVEQLEKKLSELLTRVEGAGEVEVIITLHSSLERVVEKDISLQQSDTQEADAQGGNRTVGNTNTNEDTVFVTDGSSSVPYVIKTLSPTVEGVLVLAEGAGSGNVSNELSEAVRVLLGVEAHKIKILKMAGTK